MVTATDIFYRITNYDIFKFFNNVFDFINNKNSVIIDYYSGKGLIDKSAFNELDYYLNEANHIDNLIKINSNIISTDMNMWDMVEIFENIKTKLQTIKNTPKWLRSSFSKDYEKDENIDYTLKQNMTLENVTKELGYSQFNDEWFQLAIKNSLMESDYDLKGGNKFKVTIKSQVFTDVTSVVDVITGENVLGKDILNEVVIEDNDIKSLTPKATFYQSCYVLALLRKNQNNQFPEHGIIVFEGTNKKTANLSIIEQNIVNNFRNDDTIKNIEILDSYIEENKIIFKVKIESKYEGIEVDKKIII
jgi:hypothetical protein